MDLNLGVYHNNCRYFSQLSVAAKNTSFGVRMKSYEKNTKTCPEQKLNFSVESARLLYRGVVEATLIEPL